MQGCPRTPRSRGGREGREQDVSCAVPAPSALSREGADGAQALHPFPRMHPNENLLATQTPIHANMSHAVGPDSGSRARPRARSARTHQTTGCRAPRATCARRRRATPQGRSSRPRGTAAPTCRAAQASVGLHATPYPCSAPYTRPGRAHLLHQSRTRTTADAARELGFAHFRDGVRGEPDGDREAQRARVEHICPTHTHAQACDRSGCELAKQGRHIECGCEGGRVDGAAREHVSTGARTWRDCTPRSGSR